MKEVWTLVQHSGYAYGRDPQFKRAVEERSVPASLAARIRRHGGVVFDDYTACRNAGEAENYPPGVVGLIPAANGSFSSMQIDGSCLYRPCKVDA